MNYKSFSLGDWIGHISGVIEDETTLDGNEMRDLVEFLSTLKQEPRPMEKFESVRDHIYKLAGDYKCWDNRLTWGEALELCHILCHILEQEPSKDEVILTKEEYGELVSSEFDNGYTKGYTEALEQNDVLDKIKAEIEALIEWHDCPIEYDNGNDAWYCEACNQAIEIINKYKTESEEE